MKHKTIFICLVIFLFAGKHIMAQSMRPCTCATADKGKKSWGYCDSLLTKYIVQCQYDNAEKFTNGMSKISKGGKIGYVNAAGKETIPATFDMGTTFCDDYAFVKSGTHYFYINKMGVNVFKTNFWCPLMPAPDNINESTRKYLDNENENTFKKFAFSEGMAMFVDSATRKVGYINNKGLKVIPSKYGYGTAFKEGIAFVSDADQKIKAINKKGEFVFELPAKTIPGDDGFVNGFAIIRQMPSPDLKTVEIYNYINKKGELLLPRYVSEAKNFERNYAIIKNEEREYQLINAKGKAAFNESYNFLQPTEIKGIYYYNRRNGRGFGLIDTLGVIRTHPGYDEFVMKLNDTVFLCKKWGTSVYTLLSTQFGQLLNYSTYTKYYWKDEGKKKILCLQGETIFGDPNILEYDPATGKFIKDGKVLTTADSLYISNKRDVEKDGVFKFENEHFSLRFRENMELFEKADDKVVFRNSTFFISVKKNESNFDAPEFISRMMRNLNGDSKYEKVDYYKLNSTSSLQYIKAIAKPDNGSKYRGVTMYLPIDRQYANPGNNKLYVLTITYNYADENIEKDNVDYIFKWLKFKH